MKSQLITTPQNTKSQKITAMHTVKITKITPKSQKKNHTHMNRKS